MDQIFLVGVMVMAIVTILWNTFHNLETEEE